MTDEQLAILKSFGFCMEQGQVKHLKLGIVTDSKEFAGFSSAEELRAHVKALLRNQCQWKRGKETQGN
ncbi:hypothetical protein [Brevibacillus gelatini]|uniref:hypothetical protein n=1 Tax=Brevibacillus gelatini TaxID=1655277 RepID=UPI003D81540B